MFGGIGKPLSGDIRNNWNGDMVEMVLYNRELLNSEIVKLENYLTDTIGLPTLKDILSELEKPGRDPRDEFIGAKLMIKFKK